MYRALPAVGAFLVCFPLACSKQEPPKTPAAPAPAEEEDVSNLPGKEPEKSTVVIDERILEMCDLPVPKFAFDSSALSDEASAALDALAACFRDGPAAGKGMRLVGHCDPRGTEEYNMALGQRRAGSVASHLENDGIGADRIETSSRGELDATGTDEASWALDRKVQVFLAE